MIIWYFVEVTRGVGSSFFRKDDGGLSSARGDTCTNYCIPRFRGMSETAVGVESSQSEMRREKMRHPIPVRRPHVDPPLFVSFGGQERAVLRHGISEVCLGTVQDSVWNSKFVFWRTFEYLRGLSRGCRRTHARVGL